MLFLKPRLIPRFISIWGLLATILLLVPVLLAIFDQGSHMELFLLLFFNQLFLTGWLLIKGLNMSVSE